MHVGISARALSLPVGGVKEYTSEIIRCLLSSFSEHHFTIYFHDANLCGTFPGAEEVLLAAPHKFLWDHWVLPARIRQDKPEVMWYPHNVISLGHAIPSVVTITDLAYFPQPGLPERTYALLDSIYMRRFIARSVHVAAGVMTISEWTARDVRLRWPDLNPAKLRTIYLAPNPVFRRVSAAEQKDARDKFAIERPFFLYVGSLSKRKNIPLLVNAFAKIAGEIPHDLILAGGGSGIVPELSPDGQVADYGLQSRVRQLGVISARDLVRLYNAATAFVFPSLYEGFGIPVLEAFACGCPVISSAATSLPELCGDAALVFDPHSVDALAAHIRTVANDQEEQRKLSQAGLERVTKFTYLRTTQGLMDLLLELL